MSLNRDNKPVRIEPSANKVNCENATIEIVSLIRTRRHSISERKQIFVKAFAHFIAFVARPDHRNWEFLIVALKCLLVTKIF